MTIRKDKGYSAHGRRPDGVTGVCGGGGKGGGVNYSGVQSNPALTQKFIFTGHFG